MKPSVNSRVALVTGGATVVFKELVDETLTPQFLEALQDNGFSTLLLQCGVYHDEVMAKLSKDKPHGLAIEVFDFDSDLKGRMRLCRGEAGARPAGVVISHAGTGTIADCAEVQVAQIIVANPNLMDNHQHEFAQAMARDHASLVHGHLGSLHAALPQALAVIKSLELDDLGPYQEPLFPVRDEDRLTLIDQVIAAGL